MVAGRLGDRHQPQAGDAEVVGRGRVAVVEVVEPLGEAAQVADAVAVRVGETADEHLVEDALVPPPRRSTRPGTRRRRRPIAELGGLALIVGSVRPAGDGEVVPAQADHEERGHGVASQAEREDIAVEYRIGSAGRTPVTVDTPAWVRDAVFYQIFPDRFAPSERVPKPGPLEPWDSPPTNHGFKGGDLLGIAEHLDYLEDLGVTAIYLTPIFQSASNHRYHTYDYFQVDPLLGGDDALRELLDVAHARGMRVVLDGVFNHTGRGFWPFHHILENGAASPYRDWFHIDHDVLEGRREFMPYPAAGRAARDVRSATRRGGACPRCRSSTPTTRTSASTCSRSPSTGCASASTAGGSTSPTRSTTRRSGTPSASAVGRSAPTPISSARSGRPRRTGSPVTGSTR